MSRRDEKYGVEWSAVWPEDGALGWTRLARQLPPLLKTRAGRRVLVLVQTGCRVSLLLPLCMQLRNSSEAAGAGIWEV